MKYTRENLSKLSYKDYILAIEKELNAHGFTQEGKPYEVSTNVYGGFVSDFSRGFFLSIKDEKAINYLKDIGLLNNGRCPLTGLMISNSAKTLYTSEDNSNIKFEINNLWIEYNKVKRNWGCFIGIFIIVISIIVLFCDGFDSPFYYTLGTGVALIVLSSMYGGAKFGNNWNMTCLSDKLCTNTITLYEIIKMGEKEGLSANSINKYNIAEGDFEQYQKWAYSSDLNIK